jgi:FKBP-type peptidyl-prolyl cis-trans isomerase (trigger factor)
VYEDGFKVELKEVGINGKKEIEDKLIKSLEEKNLDEFKKFIIDVEQLRNNLAHANSSNTITNVKLEISNLIRLFNSFEKELIK